MSETQKKEKGHNYRHRRGVKVRLEDYTTYKEENWNTLSEG